MFSDRLNWIRAAVLGANDGIVSCGALLLGIAAAKPSVLAIAALSAILAGACSMALGEYVSVHSQVDAEKSADLPVTVSPVRAALSSAVSFVSGASLPAGAILLTHSVTVTVAAVLVALGISGFISARLSESPPLKSVARVVVGGGLALAITYSVGILV
jgi:VIT1/CCC1 family predicted Fe2+/Mn2+ transporter